ncbi:MAG: UDP-glucose 4-epimerase GalE [Firmicutes bacterium]|nr:UDP-glucose 4-epimerase GalE [Bacillota bacterium]
MGKILVTGGAGYIGSVVTELLVARGLPVVVVDNLTQGHRAALPDAVEFFRADLLEPEQVARVFEEHPIEAVIHLAAVSIVGESVRRPVHYYQQNVTGLLNLLEAMCRAGTRRMVFSSTASVYGTPERLPLTEAAPLRPVNPYGWTKVIGEQILADAAEAHGIRAITLRYFNVAGATERCGEDHRPETHLIPCLLEVALGLRPHLELFGADYETPDGTGIRDYIHVLDLAEAHWLALEKTQQIAGVYNLGTNRGYSVREVITCVENVTGKKIPVRERPRRPGDAARLVASFERAQQELGWQPRRGLEEIVTSAWRWRQRHPHGYGS